MHDFDRRTESGPSQATLTRMDAPRALIVGGDEPTHDLLRDLLSSDGCAVLEATSGQTPGGLVPPADLSLLLVIADAPARQAVESLAGLRQRGYHARTLVLTHAPTHWLRRRAFMLDVQDVITLPADAHELHARIGAALHPD